MITIPKIESIKQILWMIIAIIVFNVFVFIAGYLTHGCNIPTDPVYDEGESDTKYIPSKKLNEFIKESESAISVYDNYIKHRTKRGEARKPQEQ